LWSVDDGRLLSVLRGHEGIVWDGVFSKDGDRVYTASFDGTVRTWFVDEEELLKTAQSRAFRPFTEDERRRYEKLLGR
jgi:WD40 repeat protein